MIKRLWHNHSLTIVSLSIGAVIVLASIPLREGTAFDLVSQLGGGLMGAGFVNALAGPFREVNKPEAPPTRLD